MWFLSSKTFWTAVGGTVAAAIAVSSGQTDLATAATGVVILWQQFFVRSGVESTKSGG